MVEYVTDSRVAVKFSQYLAKFGLL